MALFGELRSLLVMPPNDSARWEAICLLMEIWSDEEGFEASRRACLVRRR